VLDFPLTSSPRCSFCRAYRRGFEEAAAEIRCDDRLALVDAARVQGGRTVEGPRARLGREGRAQRRTPLAGGAAAGGLDAVRVASLHLVVKTIANSDGAAP